MKPEDHWLASFGQERLTGRVGARAQQLALAGGLVYATPPVLDPGPGGLVRAVLCEDGTSAALPRRGPHLGEERAAPAAEGFAVQLGVREDKEPWSACSRCSQTFGPCLHVATLAIDLACCPGLREALLGGTSSAEAVTRAPQVRFALQAEEGFDRALASWTAPAREGMRVQIAASPCEQASAFVGRAYGDRFDPAELSVVTVVVRQAGERKLLSPREIVPPTGFGAKDRRVLEHTRDRSSGKKAVHAVGVEASVALEAMRMHGGVFAEGFAAPLDFRASPARPIIALSPAEPGGLDALSAHWLPEGGGSPVPFAQAFFFPGPFPFVWTRAGAIHRVARDVDLDLVLQLARSPTLPVPPGRLRDAGIRLLRAARGRGISLPAHATFGLPPLETPRIVLRLEGEPLDVKGQLLAVYRAREVSLVPARGLAAEDGRDLDLEARARARVKAAGIVHENDEDGLVTGDATIGVAEEAAIEFWREGLVGLREATDPPVHVQLTDRLARVRVGAPLTGKVDVVLEGNWLRTKLEFRSDDLPAELAAIRMSLGHKRRWVELRDGTLARISASIGQLAEEASQVMEGDSARLPPHQLGRLDRWIRDNDGHMDLAVEKLRARLRALAGEGGKSGVKVDGTSAALPRRGLHLGEPDMPRGLHGTLRPYQRLGLAWLQFLQALGAGGILADDMGLGKTITTLAFLQRRKEKEGQAPSLVVCPTSVATNWVSEAARFTPGLRVVLHHGPSRGERAAKKRDEADIIVTTYALLRRDIEMLAGMRLRCAVLDEAQNIKNADSATTRAADRLDAEMRLALSGTPMENRLRELWSLASFANPGILGTSRAFETRYERPISTDNGSPLAAELRAVVRPFLLRRTKDDVLPELPPKTEMDRFVTMRGKDKRMYDALAHTLRASVARDVEKRGGLSSLSVFVALTRLRQMACDPRLVDPRLGAEEGAPSAKREAFLELVRELVASDRRALVFSQFVELLTLWRRDLEAENIAYEYLDGSTTKRDRVVARFQEGKAPLFLISLKAGGAGLNLTAADTVIHCDPWWNPAVEDQADARAHRIGQDKPVTVVRLVARGTIEEKILSLKEKKRDLTRAVIGDDARALEGLTAQDVKALLGEADGAFVDEPDERETSPTDVLATAKTVMDAEFEALVVEVGWWLKSTGRLATDLASMTDIPVTFANRLASGRPFPCSRAVADRIRARLRAF